MTKKKKKWWQMYGEKKEKVVEPVELKPEVKDIPIIKNDSNIKNLAKVDDEIEEESDLQLRKGSFSRKI
jgi:hypothetical protein